MTAHCGRLAVLFTLLGWLLSAQTPRTIFKVKYVAEDAIYLDGGRNAGLSAGMRLKIDRANQAVAEVEVVTVAESSAVCEVKSSHGAVQPGDRAVLSETDTEAIQAAKSFAGARKYAQVITFSEGDPLDEEAREQVPKPPLPEINRSRGRIGFDYNTIRGTGVDSSQLGLVFRGDLTRIGGSYWNLSGYWRGRMNTRAGPQQQTLNDLLNRTYHLTLSYNNPQSNWLVGIGRMYLPWASSLDTLDGGYLARRVSSRTTVGLFAGTTPDPTSWNYNPNREMFGSFVNYEGGAYESVHYTSTVGLATTRMDGRPEREFVFFENTVSYKNYVSIYEDLQVDEYRQTGQRGPAASRSFLTIRLKPTERLSLDVSDTYFRDVPTYDPRLLATGLLDKYLFQGISGGVEYLLPLRVSVYGDLGRSNRSGDTSSSLNRMYGVRARRIWKTGIDADLRFSHFNSGFGGGSYNSLTLMRDISEAMRFEFQAGRQTFASPLTQASASHFLNGTLDWFLSTRYYVSLGLTTYRGGIQNYDQVFVSLGYRFGR